jgi:hypothetical protein
VGEAASAGCDEQCDLASEDSSDNPQFVSEHDWYTWSVNPAMNHWNRHAGCVAGDDVSTGFSTGVSAGLLFVVACQTTMAQR